MPDIMHLAYDIKPYQNQLTSPHTIQQPHRAPPVCLHARQKHTMPHYITPKKAI